MFNNGKGYIQKKASVNAYIAFGKAEKPLGYWNKTDIIDAIKIENTGLNNMLLNKINLQMLMSNFLIYKGYHHIGCNYLSKPFFGINREYVKKINDNNLIDIINIQHKAETMNDYKKNRIAFSEKMEKKRWKEEVRNYLKYTSFANINEFTNALEDEIITLEDVKNTKKGMIAVKRAELEKKYADKMDKKTIDKILNDDYIESLL